MLNNRLLGHHEFGKQWFELGASPAKPEVTNPTAVRVIFRKDDAGALSLKLNKQETMARYYGELDEKK